MSNSTTYCIYRIVNFQNGKVYVGLTVNPKRRWNCHLSQLRRGIHDNEHLQRAYNHYGRSVFFFEVIEKQVSPEMVCEQEIYWITHFDSHKNGYNMTAGGDHSFDGLKRPCVWNGVDYPSVSAAARDCGITAKAMRMRLASGHTCDDDLSERQKSCIWNGIEYASITEAAFANNLTKSQMEKRVRNGYTSKLDEFVAEKPCVWNGVQYSSMKEAAQANGVEPPTMSTRIKRGFTCDDDIPKRGKRCSWNGIEYPSIVSAAKAWGLNVATLETRLRSGYTCDADIKQPRK